MKLVRNNEPVFPDWTLWMNSSYPRSISEFAVTNLKSRFGNGFMSLESSSTIRDNQHLRRLNSVAIGWMSTPYMEFSIVLSFRSYADALGSNCCFRAISFCNMLIGKAPDPQAGS